MKIETMPKRTRYTVSRCRSGILRYLRPFKVVRLQASPPYKGRPEHARQTNGIKGERLMIEIIGTPGEFITLSAHRETHLKELEAFALEATGSAYFIDSNPNSVIPDCDNKLNLIWTLVRDRRQYNRGICHDRHT